MVHSNSEDVAIEGTMEIILILAAAITAGMVALWLVDRVDGKGVQFGARLGGAGAICPLVDCSGSIFGAGGIYRPRVLLTRG
jgi:hypothetical protein